MDERRAWHFTAILRPVLAAELAPDAAGSTALALALLAAEAERDLAAESVAPEALSREIHLLPAFIAQERDGGSGDDLPALVRRFARGERPRVEPGPGTSGAARDGARLRELRQWGVDMSLIEATLAQTPAERIANMERQLVLVRQLRQAKRAREASQ